MKRTESFCFIDKTLLILFVLSNTFIICLNLCAQISVDTLKKEINPTKSYQPVYYKSSGKAMLLSVIIPGGGQFYTQNYFKGIFIAGIEGIIASYAIKNYLDYKNTNNSEFRGRATNLLWWLGLVKIFSIADAYVSANMFKFKEQQRLLWYYKTFESGLVGSTSSLYYNEVVYQVGIYIPVGKNKTKDNILRKSRYNFENIY
ncbi:MAG: DUF5683 domain-containing protein [candidate division WOR-3 bacterium]